MTKVDRQDNAVQNPSEGAAAPQMPRIKWQTEGLKSSYANFANANSTREEVVLNFGVNNSWDRARFLLLDAGHDFTTARKIT